jgi:mRNA interferase RelE/StbE
MAYQIKLTPTAIKERKRLESSIQQRVDQALFKLREEPKPPDVRKLTGSAHDWRIRVGDYRVLYEIDEQEQAVIVWRIAHRREAYR